MFSIKPSHCLRGCAAGAMAVALCSAGAAARTPSVNWVASWTGSPSSNRNPFLPTEVSVHDQTVRQFVVLSKGGSGVRIVLSNEFGSVPVHIGAASVSYESPSGRTTRVALTFSGHASAVISPGAPLMSDLARLVVPDGARLEVRMYFPRETPVTTLHELGMDLVEVSGPGDYTETESMPATVGLLVSPDPRMKGRSSSRPFLVEVDVATDRNVRTVVAFGDSITDGAGSTPEQNRRWPDLLAKRIRTNRSPLAVINQGISGNQMLADGLGVSALARFDRDVLAKPGVVTVIVMEGINDIGFSGNLVPGLSRPDVIDPKEIIAGYVQMIARAHSKGIRVIGATMTPFAGSPAYSEDKEKVREAVNTWIRRSGAFDAVIDFDAVLRDPAMPKRLLPTFDSGDFIHPSDAGYAAMAAGIDLAILH